MKFNVQLSMLGMNWFLRLQSVPTPKERAYGKSSRIPNSCHHVLFLDYDKIEEPVLIDELETLTEEYKLGNLHIFKMPDREGAYHVACLDYFTLHEVKVIAMASSCDLAFVLAPRYDRFRNWVLRDSPKGNRVKPKFLMTLKSPYDGQRKQSSAHSVLLNADYGCNIHLTNPDNNSLLRVESYLTGNRIKVK